MPIGYAQLAVRWSPLIFTDTLDLAAGTGVLIPENRMVIALMGDDVEADSVQLQLQSIQNGWQGVESFEDGNDINFVNGTWVPVPAMIISDGVNVRLFNTAGAQADNLQYAYVVQL